VKLSPRFLTHKAQTPEEAAGLLPGGGDEAKYTFLKELQSRPNVQ
jgi:hypothetical protein